MGRRHYSNTAVPTSLTDAVDQNVTTLEVPTTSGFPAVPFTICLDRGSSDEEACLVTAKDSNSFTVTRGYDGTTKFAHDVGSPVEHTTIAIDAEDANAHIYDLNRDDHAQYLTEDRVRALDLSGVTGIATVPVAVAVMYAGTTVPDANWLMCDGSAVSRTTYSLLFARLGTAYGNGDGVASFNLPDYRGRFPFGVSVSGRTQATETMSRGGVGGEEFHLLSSSEMPVHTHVQNGHSHGMGTHAHTGTTGTAGEHTHGINGGLAGFLVAQVNTAHVGRTVPGAGTGAEVILDTDEATYANNGFGEEGPMHAHTFTTAYADPGATNSTIAGNQNSGGGTAHQNMPPYQTINFMIRALP
jgi:microcystin-dependent protein